MDPNTLSMEQGKEFLKQLGIPQRDIDMMTEKWVVVAAVEVLLRFPLMPGEELSARCVSNKKCQPSMDQPHIASQSHGNPEKRKTNNQFLRKNDQKAEDMRQVAGRNIHHQPQRFSIVQNLKKPQRGPLRQKTLSPGEEDARVKCKNCGAFGHKASSRTCPMKCWGGALAPQLLSFSRKENLDQMKPQDLRIPGSVNTIDREKEPRQRHEEQQRKALPHKFPKIPQEKKLSLWMESTESCPYMRHPTRPMPLQITQKRSVLGPILTGRSPVKTPGMRSLCPIQSLKKAPELRTCGPAQRCEMNVTDSPRQALKSFCQDPPLIAMSTASRPDVFSRDAPQSSREILALNHVCNPEVQVQCPYVDSKSSPQPLTQNCGQNCKFSIQAGGKRSSQFPIQTGQKPPKKGRFSLF